MKGKNGISWIIFLIIVLAAAGGIWHWVKSRAPKEASQAGPISLPVVKCTIQDVTDFYDATGTTEAIDSVEIRARVEGYLEGIHFTDGQIVEEGQMLFTIEPEGYAAIRDEALAQLKAAQAERERARVDLERVEKAIESNAVSQQDLSTKRAAYESACAAVMAAQAALDKAELDLSYTQIRSPFRGRIGRHLADVGNLVGPTSRPILTTLVRLEPIYVFFYMSESLMKGDFIGRLRGTTDEGQMPFLIGFADEADYPFRGQICYVDNTVEPKTGTVYIRGQIGNEKEQLLPGMFVRVRVPIQERPKAVLIPERVIQTDLSGKFVLVVGPDNVLERRQLTLGATQGLMRVILSGLDGSETILSSGFHLARQGIPIQPVLEEQGASEKAASSKAAKPDSSSAKL